MKRKVNAIWKGDGPTGSGVLNAQSGAFDNMPYSFKTRFEMITECLEQTLRNLLLQHLQVVLI